MVLERLVGNNDNALAARVGFNAVNDTIASADTTSGLAYVWRLKAIAHERLGETERAAEGYRKAAELASTLDGEGTRTLFLRDSERMNKRLLSRICG